MKAVPWIDDDGYKREALIRMNDPDELASEIGIQRGPPDISKLDWEAVQRDLHNMLMDMRLFTWEDVQVSQNGVSSAIKSCLRRRVIELYRT